MIKYEIIQVVLRKFLTSSRRPGFVDKVLPDGTMPYAGYEEPNSEIYISSAYYKSNWSWDRFKTYTDAMLRGLPYFACALPYQLGIKESIIMKSSIINEMRESDFNELLFKMEMETIPYGESEKAFFKFDDLNKLRNIDLPLMPLTDQQFVELREGVLKKRNFYRTKRKGEIRILAMDVALMASNAQRSNDATVFTLISCLPDGTEFEKSILYAETIEGVITQRQALHAKRLYYDLECDYFVLDAHGVGTSVFDMCVERTMDYERNTEYPAWTCFEGDSELINRCRDVEAVPVMFPIKVSGYNATATNHDMAIYTKSQILSGKLRLLLTETEASDKLMAMIEFRRLAPEQQATIRLAYMQTTFMINEMINLESEVRSGYIRLTEPNRRARKDRYSSLAYGLYFVKRLEMDLKHSGNGVDDFELLSSYIGFF